ncbi:MAG: PKD domain-containing protein, partial [Bacteroidetes bacterium]|nr:PKD domain-containing protein [Bacteroidota bacterium]
GDPIVLYDKAADRWFLSQFGSSGNKIYIAISTTNDPTGSYYTYTFTSPAFPDYLKFSVWQDGYYMTSNQAQKVFVFERTKMLAGNPASRSVYQTFSPPNAGYFFVPLPGDTGDGAMAPAGTPCPIFSYSDNGWGGTYTDAVNIYKVTVNWVPTTPTETIASAGVVPTTAFDASYDPSWNDCSQPGTTQKLDGIGGTLMFRAQWKSWTGYNTVVLNWGVKISATQRSIKWCELRQDQGTGVWSMYQQGIYTPDAATRWMGSIAMDNNGSIALCYVKSDASSIYPGLYYTGRRTCDPLGTLPVTEAVAKLGTGSQTGINRDGDYAQTWLDPDGVTFWHTGLYMGGATGSSAARTQIYSFQIAPCVAVAPVANFSATPTTICAGSSVTFTDLSVNTPTSWAWTFTGGTPSSSTVQNPVVVYNTPGTYNVTLVSTNASGSSAPVTMTSYITVNAIPAAPVATNTGPFCAGSTINLFASTVAGATYAWTGPSTFTSAIQNATRPSATAAMAGTYSVTATVAGCTSLVGTTTVVINSLPVITAEANLTYCPGASVPSNSFVSTPVGATYTWTNSNTAIGLVASGTGSLPVFTATNTTSSAITATIIVTPTLSGCVGATSSFTITVNLSPVVTAETNVSVCAGATVPANTFVSTPVGATYTWTNSNTAIGLAASGSTSTPSFTATNASASPISGTITITPTLGGCAGTTSTYTITVNPIPATPVATNTGPFCPGTTINLLSSTIAGAAYSWTGPSTFTSAIQNATRPSATAAMAGTYSVTATVAGCTSLVGTTTVVVSTVPVVTAETNISACNGAPIPANTFASTPAGATYTWTNSTPSIGLAASGTTSLPTFTATNSTASPVVATITVTPTLAGCAGTPITFTITVNPTPVATFTSSANQCLTANSFGFTNTGSSGVGFTYSWTFAGGAPTSSTTNSPTGVTFSAAGTHNIIHTITSTAGCIGSTSVLVTVFPSPTALAVTTAASSCSTPTGTITIGVVTGGTA